MKPAMLCIDDDQEIYELLKISAVELDFDIHWDRDGSSGLASAEQERFSIVILDLGLPGISGMEVCRRLRTIHPTLPIIILTSRADELTKILALELGADDYVSKPFSVAELTARMRAILRRVESYKRLQGTPEEVLRGGDIELHTVQRKVYRKGLPVELSHIEYELLKYLMQNAKPISREELTENVWGYRCSGFDGTVTSYISRLRAKVEDDPAKPRHVLTVRNFGYRFLEGDEPGATEE